MKSHKELALELIETMSKEAGVESPKVKFISECDAYYDYETKEVVLPEDIKCAEYLAGGDVSTLDKYLVTVVHETFHYLTDATDMLNDRSVLNDPSIQEKLVPLCKKILEGEKIFEEEKQQKREELLCIGEAWAWWFTKEFVRDWGICVDVEYLGDVVMQSPELWRC